jgi:mannose-1-phosphate guanylyltransferase
MVNKEIEYPYNLHKKIALILAGGSGKKFWPVSTSDCPEQFVNLVGEATLFQKIYELINSEIISEDIWLVSKDKYIQLILEQIPGVNLSNIIKEPTSRQTASALGLSLALLDDKYSDDTIFCIFPSDQWIKNVEEFNLAMDTACKAAYDLNALVTIGTEPKRPAVHYGYIQYCDEINDELNSLIDEEMYANGLRKSINFAEKPDKKTAQRFIDSGDFVWNSGILVARKDVLFKSFERNMNYHYEQFRNLQKYIGTPEFEGILDRLYKTFNKISIDYGILENADNIYVIKSTFAWSDLNDWDELYRILMKDANDNVLLGNVIDLDCNNTLAISNDKLIAAIGMEDVVIINTEKAILLCKKSEANKTEKIVEYLKTKNIPLY